MDTSFNNANDQEQKFNISLSIYRLHFMLCSYMQVMLSKQDKCTFVQVCQFCGREMMTGLRFRRQGGKKEHQESVKMRKI